MKLENVDAQLQEIAEYITESGLSFSGAEFEHIPTGEDFVVTVSRKNFATNHDRLVDALKDLVYCSENNTGAHPSVDCYHRAIEESKSLLKELGHEI